MLTAKICKTNPNAIIPTVGSAMAAGHDLYACFDSKDASVTIHPGECVKIGTGVSITPPPGYFGAIFPRSGIATKRGLRLANSVGVADEDYTGQYIVPLYNDSSEDQIIYYGDRIAQLVFLPWQEVGLKEVPFLSETERGDSGFGSTGTK